MPYRALYRQWRPKDFSHMVGQKAVIDTLRNQVVHDRIAHAYLFCGSRGTGKTSTAKIMARAINCEHPVNGDPCGECANCQRMEKDESLDVIEIDAASNNGVDEMRDLRETVKYPPQYGRYKVYIIDEVHMLSTSAFNALLKTLEEPPAHIVFILATTEPQKLPETILSRCQRFDFGRIAASDIQERLREAAEGSGAKVSPGALMLIARAAEGGMRDALSILDMCLGYGDDISEEMVRGILGTCDRGFLFQYGKALAEENAGEIFRMIDRIMRDGRDPAVFARDVSDHIRTLLLAKCCPEEMNDILDLTEEDTKEFRQQAEDFTVTRLMKILDLYMSLETEMRYASSPRLALENVSLKCCVRTEETDAQAVNDRMAEMEKKLEELQKRIAEGVAVPAVKAEKPEKKETARAPKAEAEKPKAAPRPAGGNAGNVWKDAMNQFMKTEPFLYSVLSAGMLVSGEGNTFLWQPEQSEGMSFLIDSIRKEDKKNRIQEVLKGITGEDCVFEVAQGKAQKEDNSEQAYINSLYETFGQEPVIIKD
jgi:DNA polymerase-3 subunit gamma/tau